MKYVVLLLSFLCIFNFQVFADEIETPLPQSQSVVDVYSSKNRFGLVCGEKYITKPIYKKLIRLGESSWIVQYKTKYGVIDSNGDYLILPKYRNVERFFGKYVKLGNDNNYGLYDEFGRTIIQPEYSSIDPMFGNMFLTCKNYKYGIVDINGNTILQNEFDDIYMPKPNVLMIQYQGSWCEIEKISESEITLPKDIEDVSDDTDLKITQIVKNTGAVSGYSVLTFTDYVLKVFTSISPAYEQTIDELMFSQGAETVNILIKFTWLPKFPLVYAKHFYRNLRNPSTGLLRNQIKFFQKRIK